MSVSVNSIQNTNRPLRLTKSQYPQLLMSFVFASASEIQVQVLVGRGMQRGDPTTNRGAESTTRQLGRAHGDTSTLIHQQLKLDLQLCVRNSYLATGLQNDTSHVISF